MDTVNTVGTDRETQQTNEQLRLVLQELQHKEYVLRQQFEQNERLQRLRDDLTRAIIHDLGNPLTATLTALDGLMQSSSQKLDESEWSMLEVAYLGTQKAVRLVQDVLDVSRLEKGQMPLQRAPTALTGVISETLQSQMPLAEAKEIHIEWRAPPDLPVAWVDADLVERVLQNLLDNAIKFTPKGGKICVDAELDSADGVPAQVRVRVSDTGPGIDSEVQKRLFEKFSAGQHHGAGTGLGLAFCKLAVDAHGGQISVDSWPDRGTTFTVSLPIVPAG